MSEIPENPADHAKDFAERYASELDYHASHAMQRLGIPDDKNGMPDHEHGSVHTAFHRAYPNAGGVSPDGRIVIGHGILNPALMEAEGPEASLAWKKSRLLPRLESAIAHEYEEHRGGSHEYAVEHAPDTDLPISHEARELSRKIRDAARDR
jgi:hypothetical protein